VASPLDHFVSTFLRPLVEGGHVEVEGLLGPGLFSRFTESSALDATLRHEYMHAVSRHTARLGPTCAPEILPPDAIALGMVWHNLLAMTHPEVRKRAGLRERVIRWNDQLLGWVGAPRTAEEVTLRYACLAMLPSLGRVDTDVSFWAGSARYLGVAPPSRLLAWKTVRRVKETKTRVPLFELLKELASEHLEIDLVPSLQAALRLSPLLDIALVDRPAFAAFDWSPPTLNAAGDPALRGAMIRLLLRRDAVSERTAVESVSSRARVLEGATIKCLRAEPALPSACASLLLQLHLELLLTEAAGRNAAPAVPMFPLAWDAVIRLGAERVAQVVGLPADRVEHLLSLETTREPVHDAPAAMLLSRAMALEVVR
jgi:hypothetical protein